VIPSRRSQAPPGDSLRDSLFIQAPCPQCGASLRWSLLQTLAQCRYCSSLLWWPHDPLAPEYFRVRDQIGKAEDLLDILQTYDAYREEARLRGCSGDPSSETSIPHEASDWEIKTIKARRRHLFTLHEHHSIYVPYLMVYAILAFSVLGRPRSQSLGRKSLRPCCFVLEDILPAYDPALNFRDRGLWFSRESLEPLDEALLAARPFLKPRGMQVDIESVGRKWLSRRLLFSSDLEAVFFQGDVASLRVWHIFRPYHLVCAGTPEGTRWYLIDGQFRTLAGRLTPAEAEAMRSPATRVLGAGNFQKPGIRQLPCHCPICGADVNLEEGGLLQLCGNCGRLLAPSRDGFSPQPYRTLPRRDVPWWPDSPPPRTAWIPFWQVHGAWSLNGKNYPSMTRLLEATLPPRALQLLKECTPPESFLFPGFEAWTHDGYDRWSLKAASALAQMPLQGTETRFHTYEPVGREDRVILPSQDATLYTSLVHKFGPAYLPDRLHLQLNPLLLKALFQARFLPARDPDLLFIPIPVAPYGDLPDRMIGPGEVVDFMPVLTRDYPPGIHRTVRRWKSKGEEAEREPKEEETESIWTRPHSRF
jgi:hypothetical protein